MPLSCSRTNLRVHTVSMKRRRPPNDPGQGKWRTGLGIEEERHRNALLSWRHCVRLSVRAGRRDLGSGLSNEGVHHRSTAGVGRRGRQGGRRAGERGEGLRGGGPRTLTAYIHLRPTRTVHGNKQWLLNLAVWVLSARGVLGPSCGWRTDSSSGGFHFKVREAWASREVKGVGQTVML